MNLVLPWPASKLNPNQRIHFAQKAKIAAKHKAAGYFIAKTESISAPIPDGKIHLHLLFHQPDRRKRDLDNLLSAMKSTLDGVALAYGVNDTRFRPITIDFAEGTHKGGKVELWFE